jgi:hypothetical protein
MHKCSINVSAGEEWLGAGNNGIEMKNELGAQIYSSHTQLYS